MSWQYRYFMEQKYGDKLKTPVPKETSVPRTIINNTSLTDSDGFLTNDWPNKILDLVTGAPLASPALTGTPTAPTNSTATDATTQIATDAFVQSAISASTATTPITLSASLAGAAPSSATGFNGDYILDTDSAHVWGPKTGGAWPATAIVLPASANSVGGSTLPSGAIVETVSRKALTSSTAAVGTGTMCGALVHLQAGTILTSLSFYITSTMSGATHQWFAVLDTTGKVLAVTADDTSNAWASGAKKTLNLTSPLTIPTTGGYYLCFCVAATTMPNFFGYTGPTPVVTPYDRAQVSGQSTPPVVNSTLTLAQGFNMYYGYAS